MDVTNIYATIAAGDTPDLSDEDLRWVRKPLYEQALREVDAAEPAGRIAALRVAAWLGLDRAVAVPAKLVRDADRSVRVSAFNLAVAAGDSGRPLLRDLLLGTDAQLSAASLDLLGRLQDQPALQAARRLVAHPDPAVRVAAITLVGLVGGASTRPALAEAQSDPDAVREAKRRARAWLGGDEAKPAPSPWWIDGPQRIVTDAVTVGADAVPIHTAAEGPSTPRKPAPAPADDAPSPPSEPAATAPPQAKEDHALVPTSPTEPAPTDNASSSTTSSAGLPDPLPEEPRALAKLYGMVASDGRDALLPVLRNLDPGALASVWVAWTPGADPAVGRGVALAAAHLGRTAFLSKARTLIRSDEAGVRSAAVEALGALGGMSTLSAMKPMLADPAPEVRAATVTALQGLSIRVDREGMARSWVASLPTDDAQDVVDAIAAWPVL